MDFEESLARRLPIPVKVEYKYKHLECKVKGND